MIKFAAGNKPPVRGILDKPMIQKELVGLMRAQGVDIFPDYDSHCYIEGKAVYMLNTWCMNIRTIKLVMIRIEICNYISSHKGLPLKDIQTERHLYYCMSLVSNSLNFTWSRWNLLSGYDKLVMQYR